MKVPKSWKKVTPVTKATAFVLFITLPFFGMLFGMQYQKAVDSYNYFYNAKPTPAVITPPNTLTISMADNGKTLYAHTGDTVKLSLGETYKWGISFSDGSLLRVENGEYIAAKPGTEIITATGTVNCKKGQLCPLLAIYFATTIVIK